LSVIGHADAQGADEMNDRLALQRARAVVRQLWDKGLNRDIPMLVESYGKRMPRIPTPDGVPEARNRRVEITVR
jgi:OOP family OmpA-OmpF porin